MKKIYYALLLALTYPPSVFAVNTLRDYLISFRKIINLAIPLLFGLGLLFFFWGGAQFVLNSADQKTREDGKRKMLWGVIALFVMASIYGILNFIGTAVGLPVNGNVPCNTLDGDSLNLSC